MGHGCEEGNWRPVLENLGQAPSLRGEFGSTNRDGSFGAKEVRVRFGKGGQFR